VVDVWGKRGDMSEPTRTSYKTCPLCEANCGLEIVTRGREVVAVRGDEQDVLSHGFICPKGTALGDVDTDPDRLRDPLLRQGDGFGNVTWAEAFAQIEEQLSRVIGRYGRDSVAVYLGNPSAHHLSLGLYTRVLVRALGSHNVYSASTVDQMPKQVSSGLLFGAALTIPIPDIDRTGYVLMLGADPLVSNGSLLTAPDIKARLRALRARGGKLVVIDPRRSRTAEEASEHHFIRPGTDAYFLFGIVHTLVAENLARPSRLAEHTNGLDRVAELAKDFAPEVVTAVCGIPASVIRRLARELAAAERAVVYARFGTCTQEFGTVTSWLVDVINLLTGNLDRPGGAMFPKGAAGAGNAVGTPGRGRGVRFGRFHSRVRRRPECFGELPAVSLAEEMETPGEGQVRALITIAGNPVLSTPNGARLSRALASLEFMVSLDIYVNETTRHATVILPGVSPLEQPHYPFAFTQLAVRNFVKYSPAVFSPDPGRPADWEILLRLAAIAGGQGVSDVAALDDFVFEQQLASALQKASASAVQETDTVRAALAGRRGPERLLDLLLRTGPYGDGFGARRDGLTLAGLEASPHGIDLGPLEPRLPEALRTPSGKIELAPEPIIGDVARLRARLARPAESLVLIGRRELRSNNSWMHNLPQLVSGRARCTMHVHPTDAERLGLRDGETAVVTSRTGTVTVPVEVTDRIMPGVVSIPHGWGHDQPGIQMRVAAAHAGACSNFLADEELIDPLSGNAVLNGIPVTVARAG